MVMHELLHGAAAGAAATVPMTGVILGAKEAGLLYVPPPQQITARAEQKTGAGDTLSRGGFTLSWLAAHVGFGAGAGAIYGLTRPLLPGPVWLKGLIFGAAVWGVSYLKVLPGLGLYPPPSRDRGSRTATMIAAHLVYGSVLAEIDHASNR